jgi:hypothetical protein
MQCPKPTDRGPWPIFPERRKTFSSPVPAALFFTGVGEVSFSVCRISHISPTDSSSIYRTVAMLRLSDELNDTTGLLDLLLSQAADPAGADDQRDLGETALSEDLGVTEREEVEDGDGVLLLTLDVGVTGLLGDEGPELEGVSLSLKKIFAPNPGESRGVVCTLSRLMMGFQKWFCCLWKYRIPTFPK